MADLSDKVRDIAEKARTNADIADERIRRFEQVDADKAVAAVLRKDVTMIFVWCFVVIVFMIVFLVGVRAFFPKSVDEQAVKDGFSIMQTILAVVNFVIGYYFGSTRS